MKIFQRYHKNGIFDKRKKKLQHIPVRGCEESVTGNGSRACVSKSLRSADDANGAKAT